jgi:hypothetical protein
MEASKDRQCKLWRRNVLPSRQELLRLPRAPETEATFRNREELTITVNSEERSVAMPPLSSIHGF